ncbi:tetratricopeptide repeat protein [Rubrolithibacter danxiaensis]|uniref:tetratricopeptide repeat protein n=1 Tax=Rubrolithibacter danxiaensis TaxID=3390805 RepID=UPI003BF8C931
MLKRKQITVIGLVVVLMGLLLSLDIKGLVKEEGQHANGAAAATAAPAQSITVESVSETAKQGLNSNLEKQVSDLEANLKAAPENQKVQFQKQLSQLWDDVNQPAPAALYMEAVAEKESSFSNWLKAGDLFAAAYQNTQDSLIQPSLTQKAANAYKQALKLEPNNLAAKTGLGVAYVNGAASPMQGIQLLLEVVKEDPSNTNANLNLGLFSMKSGQFDKAVARFKTVIENKPSPEVWFYLASSFESLGEKAEAIAAYKKSEELAANPNLTKFVENKIIELSK